MTMYTDSSLRICPTKTIRGCRLIFFSLNKSFFFFNSELTCAAVWKKNSTVLSRNRTGKSKQRKQLNIGDNSLVELNSTIKLLKTKEVWTKYYFTSTCKMNDSCISLFVCLEFAVGTPLQVMASSFSSSSSNPLFLFLDLGTFPYFIWDGFNNLGNRRRIIASWSTVK